MNGRIGFLLCLLTLPLSAATFTVTSPLDSGPGTLRQAILDANALGAGPHTIAFNIAPAGPHTITPESELPALTAEETLLDATTQPGYAGAPIIEISGQVLRGSADGLRIDGARSRVQGFVINLLSQAINVRASGVQVMNNYLGLGLDGSTVRPNFRGVFCNNCNTLQIGGPAGNGRNVISGNIQGIWIAGFGNNIIRSNYIGTDATGMFARGNRTGIDWTESAGQIGDAAASGANVISGNIDYGVQMTGLNFDASIVHNLIGVAADGTTPLGNGFEGVSLYASGTSISQNTIAHNLGHGVMVPGIGHERNAIRANSIFSNRLRGIALGALGGPAPNDPQDTDGGAYANNLQNHPVLTSAIWNAGRLTVRGTLNSIPNRTFHIDVFSNTVCDPSGFGEGEVFRLPVQVTTNADGDAAINVNFAYPGTGFITATATNRDAGETSELSQCRVVTNALASTVQLDAATTSVNEGDGFATVIVTRSGSSVGPATVEVVTTPGTASTPGDYLPPASSLLVWNDGDGAPQTVLIPIVADDLFEPPEQFSVELRNATGAALGATTIGTITIVDDAGGTPMPADLSIGISTPASAAAQGEPVTYEIVTVNLGPNDATGVTMMNVLPAKLLFADITAPPGWSCTTPAALANGTILCTSAILPVATSAHFLVGTIVAFDATGSIVNSASVSHSGTDPNPGNSFASSNATTATPTTADLSVAKTADRPGAAGGSTFPYTITVTNSGPGTASKVTMTDVLPPQLQFVSRVITTTAGTDFSCTTPEVNTNGTITCNANRMAPGATATLTLQVRVVESATTGTVRNTATVTSPTTDPDTTDRSATAPGVELVPGADLLIIKETATTAARPGAIFDYKLSIQNTGPSAATNVVLTDVLPAELLFESVGPPAAFTCTAPPAGTNGTVTCTAPTLPTLTVAAFTLRVRVAPGAGPGTVTNRATVTSSTPDRDDDDMTAASLPVTLALPAGTERRLDPNPAAPRMPQTAPQVATTRENALAVWREGAVPFAPPGGTASIRGALFRPDVEGETLIEFAAPEQGTDVAYPNVAAAVDRYLVVWRESKSEQGRIVARRIRIDGSFIDAQPLVLETGEALGCCPDADDSPGDPRPAVASNGRDFYVTWVSASYDIRGIVVPGEGPITGEPSILSRETGTAVRAHFDLEIVWTPAMYVVVWLDRLLQNEPPIPLPLVLRYARVTSAGVLLDPQVSNSIGGPVISSITATSFAGGAAVTIDYDNHGEFPASRQWCLGVLPFTASGEPGDIRSLRCDPAPGFIAAPAIHSTLVPTAGGFVLVQPGRRYTPPFSDVPVRTSTADDALTAGSDPTVLDAVAREASVANWRGAALLVYNRTDGEAPATRVPRVFAFLMEGPGRGRAVRH